MIAGELLLYAVLLACCCYLEEFDVFCIVLMTAYLLTLATVALLFAEFLLNCHIVAPKVLQ